MHKFFFVIFFSFFIWTSLFAESHYIHDKITNIHIEIEDLKKKIENQDIQQNIQSLDKKINKLNINDKNINVTVENYLKALIFELKLLNEHISKKIIEEKKHNKLNSNWSPSDWGTIGIALLTFFLVIFTGRSVYLLSKQNIEQREMNNKSIELLKEEHIFQINSIKLSHLENQIDKVVLSLDFLEKELGIFRGKFIDLSSLDSDSYNINLFSYKFNNLVILINKSLRYGFELDSLNVILGKYIIIAKVLYNRKKIDEATYRHFKIMLASSLHIGRDIFIDLNKKFVEELKTELGSFDKNDILEVRYYYGKTIDDILVKYKVELTNGLIYKRDEKGIWIFDK